MNPIDVATLVEGKAGAALGSPVLSPSLHSLINSFNSEGKNDRALFLALLSAKTAEDKVSFYVSIQQILLVLKKASEGKSFIPAFFSCFSFFYS